MPRIKVLHVLTTTAGGLGQSVLSLVRELDPQQFEVCVAFGPGHPLDAAFADAGIRVLPVRMARGLAVRNFGGLVDLVGIMRCERPAIVHAHSSMAGALARLAACVVGGSRVVFSLHGYASLMHRSTSTRALLALIDRLLDHGTDHYVAVSHYVYTQWCARGIVAASKITVIHHGQRLEPPTKVAFAPAITLASLYGRPLVGTVALLEVQKGTEYLLRAMPDIRRQHPRAACVVVGDGPLRGRLEDLAGELGVSDCVYFLGWRDDAARLISHFDVYCLPSLNESFGLVLLEAMAQAKPVVASAVGGVPEVVADGATGTLVPAADPRALATAICRYLADRALATRHGAQGYQRLVEHFTSSTMARKYEKLYMRICAGRP